MRPPFGAVDAHVRAALAARHLQTVLWDVDTEDWEEPGTKHVVHELEHEARPGRVVLLHDGGGDRHETVAALRQALPVLARRGYRFEALPGC
ncbi:hypothetical protein GCM10025868_30140 [Angustibacter aerolatus]|uniref:NodB homology domain-containing protein n=1 Tax=Angustibacter aerolatus TaxID=1162965 RepID=A0ABQ6JIT8_9ACTN|nr:hypothetical protein GCM10025868_30140 [Angustibacter aerolatus]